MTIHRFVEQMKAAQLDQEVGWVRRVLPSSIEADGPWAPLGSLCEIEATAGSRTGQVLAQVTGVAPGAVTLALLEAGAAVTPGAKVVLANATKFAPAGDALVGRAVDGLGRPIDGGKPVEAASAAALDHDASEALSRASTSKLVRTGIRAIDGLLPLGEGQRIGVFAASGVGKTSLMAQIARQVEAERCVICLVGERGHELGTLWKRTLSDELRGRSTLVAAAADQPAAMRVRAAEYAIALARSWRDEGRRVLLLFDSVTRLAMALREIGLAAGEPPTVRGYTPSVFSVIARMVEHCGALEGGGAVTAVFTILAETDDVEDPLTEAMKSLLDGHIVLSRALAEQGHFPAIDVPRSVSRWAGRVVDEQHRGMIKQATAALSTYEEARTLIESGVYASGSEPAIDDAIALRRPLQLFLQQDQAENATYAATRAALQSTLSARG